MVLLVLLVLVVLRPGRSSAGPLLAPGFLASFSDAAPAPPVGVGAHLRTSPPSSALAEQMLPCINLHTAWQNVCLCHFCKSSSWLCCLHIVAVIEVLEL